MFSSFRDRGGPDERLESELKGLEKRARRAVPGLDAPLLNRAGDLCLEAGKRDRALTYYGRSIDAYLASGRFDAAAAVCRKLLRISPQTVRARCTLTWLSIGKGHLGDAQREVSAYVQAAKKAGQERIAARHLGLMKEATVDEGFRRRLSSYLGALGADVGVGALPLERGGRRDPGAAAEDPDARWERVLRAALTRPEELGI